MKNSGGLMLFIREDIPATLKMVEKLQIEAFFVELTINKKKWLLCCSYNTNQQKLNNHITYLPRNLDSYEANYDNILLLGDVNAECSDPIMSDFCNSYNLRSLITSPTCYKAPEKPRCIDLCPINKPRNFQNACGVETGLSDFHKMTIVVNKSCFQKMRPNIIETIQVFLIKHIRQMLSQKFLSSSLREIAQKSLSTSVMKSRISMHL